MKRRSHRGFALVDLAVATCIGGAILGGLVTLTSARIIASREHDAQNAIAEAQRALVAYAQVHRRLPCPANPRAGTSDPRAGQEGTRRNGQCEFGYQGALPWNTLGLPELDVWGTRFTYRVAADFADGADRCNASAGDESATCLRLPEERASYTPTVDSLVVKEDRGDSSANPEVIAHGLAAIVISHGPNGLFGYSAVGQQRVPTNVRAARHEASNADPRSLTFYTHPVDRRLPVCDGIASISNCAHDDLVGWLARGEITTAMVKAGHR